MEMVVSDIQGRKETAPALKPGEGESPWAATANVSEKQALQFILIDHH